MSIHGRLLCAINIKALISLSISRGGVYTTAGKYMLRERTLLSFHRMASFRSPKTIDWEEFYQLDDEIQSELLNIDNFDTEFSFEDVISGASDLLTEITDLRQELSSKSIYLVENLLPKPPLVQYEPIAAFVMTPTLYDEMQMVEGHREVDISCHLTSTTHGSMNQEVTAMLNHKGSANSNQAVLTRPNQKECCASVQKQTIASVIHNDTPVCLYNSTDGVSFSSHPVAILDHHQAAILGCQPPNFIKERLLLCPRHQNLQSFAFLYKAKVGNKSAYRFGLHPRCKVVNLTLNTLTDFLKVNFKKSTIATFKDFLKFNFKKRKKIVVCHSMEWCYFLPL